METKKENFLPKKILFTVSNDGYINFRQNVFELIDNSNSERNTRD